MKKHVWLINVAIPRDNNFEIGKDCKIRFAKIWEWLTLGTRYKYHEDLGFGLPKF